MKKKFFIFLREIKKNKNGQSLQLGLPSCCCHLDRPNDSIHNDTITDSTSGSAMAEGPRDALVSRNSATTKYRYRVALFA